MDIDEDDDFYAPEEPDVQTTAAATAPAATVAAEIKGEAQPEELEEGEEEDEGGEMDEDDDDDDDSVLFVYAHQLFFGHPTYTLPGHRDRYGEKGWHKGCPSIVSTTSPAHFARQSVWHKHSLADFVLPSL
jgi:hypothetical protein